MKLTCRSLGAFVAGHVSQITIAPGLAVMVGRRATSGADRMKATRKIRRSNLKPA